MKLIEAVVTASSDMKFRKMVQMPFVPVSTDQLHFTVGESKLFLRPSLQRSWRDDSPEIATIYLLLSGYPDQDRWIAEFESDPTWQKVA